MLKNLSVQNYALIDRLNLELHPGFTAITGETGAGKSILLGALGHILGKRADLQVLRDRDRKCVIEGSFALPGHMEDFFLTHDLDFEELTLIRREITPSGKSRAFVNDTPVTLDVLQKLAQRLIDVHSQHQNILLNDRDFQLELLDSFADNGAQRSAYQEAFRDYRASQERLQALEDQEGEDEDYLQFLYEELEAAQLQKGEQEEWEQALEQMEHHEDIQTALQSALQLADDEEKGALGALRQMHANLLDVMRYDPDCESLAQRCESLRIELDDIRLELEEKLTQNTFDPTERDRMDQRLSKIIALQKKHQVESVEELIEKRESLKVRLANLADLQANRETCRRDLAQKQANLESAAQHLRHSRESITKGLEEEVGQLFQQLNLPHARLRLDLETMADFGRKGRDQVAFFFSANAGQELQPLQKVASGGELSRVMLALKAILAQSKSLPTIFFDEIDAGVSGETAGKIGRILARMGSLMQVISITHLPQIAALAEQHLLVSKELEHDRSVSRLRVLNEEERLRETARLLSGDRITEAALANARQLLSDSQS